MNEQLEQLRAKVRELLTLWIAILVVVIGVVVLALTRPK